MSFWLQIHDMAKFPGCNILKRSQDYVTLQNYISDSLFLSIYLLNSPPLWISSLQNILSPFLLHLFAFVRPQHSEGYFVVYIHEGE
jgi:hypothetical protein